MSGENREILVVPFHSQGHTFPATELCNHLASRNYHITLFLPSSPSSSSSSAPLHPLIKIAECSIPSPPQNDPTQHPPSPPNDSSFEDYLSKRSDGRYSSPPIICAVVDVMMSHLVETCKRYEIPVISFFTASACATAREHAKGKLLTETTTEKYLAPGDTLTVPGLPEDMALTVSELTHRESPPDSHGDAAQPQLFQSGYQPGPQPPFGPIHHSHPSHQYGSDHRLEPPPLFGPMHHHGPARPPFGPMHHGGPPPINGPGHHGGQPHPFGPGGGPNGIGRADGAMALIFNTCDELERPFLDYIAKETNKPVWGVGPLLPAEFWSSTGSTIHDGEVRSTPESSVSECEVREWLDSKPRGSVIYVSFGTMVSPTDAELSELEAALVESTRPFIWVLQQRARKPDRSFGGYFPNELARLAEWRGLVVQGWAPQLLILSHPSTAMFISHCGWNSTVEALCCGVPMLAWPIRGDQLHSAKLITSRLRVGCAVQAAGSDAAVTKSDVVKGIERLVCDEEIRDRAAAVRSDFAAGFPNSSAASLDDFLDFLREICHLK